MKKTILVLALTSINFSAVAAETSWLDSLKNLVGLGDSTPVAIETVSQSTQKSVTDMVNTDGLIDMLTSSLNVSGDQAEGGMGSIFNYVKENVSVDQFTQLASALPGVDSLLGQVPETTDTESETTDTESKSSGLSGMLDTASQYSDSLKSINDVKKQFEALGLDPEMIGQYITSAQSYLDTPQGAEAKKLFTQGVEKLIGA